VASEAALRAAISDRSEKSVGTMIFRIEFNIIFSSSRTNHPHAGTFSPIVCWQLVLQPF
jgi:hypothetical protein